MPNDCTNIITIICKNQENFSKFIENELQTIKNYNSKHHEIVKILKQGKYGIILNLWSAWKPDYEWLENLLPQIATFLNERLKLTLHPDKIFIKTLASGVDFLGWINFPDHRVVSTVTKKRMLKNIKQKKGKEETVQSCIGLLSHGNTKKLSNLIINKYVVEK